MGRLKYKSKGNLKAKEIERLLKQKKGRTYVNKKGQLVYLTQEEAEKRDAANLRRRINRELKQYITEDYRQDLLSQKQSLSSNSKAGNYSQLQSQQDYFEQRRQEASARREREAMSAVQKRREEAGKIRLHSKSEIYAYTYNRLWTTTNGVDVDEILREETYKAMKDMKDDNGNYIYKNLKLEDVTLSDVYDYFTERMNQDIKDAGEVITNQSLSQIGSPPFGIESLASGYVPYVGE